MATKAIDSLIAEGEPIRDPDRRSIAINADQLEVSPDGRWLSFRRSGGVIFARVSDDRLGGRIEGMMLTGTCHCEACQWTLAGDPGWITACNCTLCRRYGVLWAYDYENERIRVSGPTRSYTRMGKLDPALEILFCPNCACVLAWRGLRLEEDRRRRIAVNVRLAPPEAVVGLAIDHFDGLDTFEDLPSDGRCVRDIWF